MKYLSKKGGYYMKKSISLLAAVILAFVIGTTAFAADFYVDEAEMHISLPSYHDVFTVGMDKDIYNRYGYSDSYEDTMFFLEENELLLYSNSWDGYSSVMVNYWEDYGINYFSCTESKLNEEKAEWLSSFTSDGSYTALKEEIVSVGSNKYIRFLLKDSNGNYDITYITTHDRDLVLIDFITVPEGFNDEFIKMAKESVESIVFGDIKEAEKLPASEHYVPELGAYVSVPDKYYVMTSEGYDSWFSEYFSEEELQSIIDGNIEDNIYFTALDESLSYDFSVNVNKNEYLFTDENDYFDFVKDTYNSFDITILNEEVVEIGGINYIHITYKWNTDASFGSAYFALNDEKLIIYTLLVSYGELTERLEAELYSMVESTRYETAEGADEPSVDETEPLIITDEVLGFSMTVPENWVEDDFEIGDTFESMRTYLFRSVKDETQIISCAAMSMSDFVSDITLGFVEFTEEDFSNGTETEEDYARYLEVPEESVTKTKLGENIYFVTEKEESEMLTTQAAIIKDGVFYVFVFYDTAESEYYSDFELFLSDIQYPKSPVIDETVSSEKEDKVASAVITVLIVLIVIAVLIIGAIVAVIVIASKKSKKAELSPAVPPVEESSVPAEEPFVSSENNNFCTRCGAKLKSDSDLCPNCGKPVDKE